MLGYLPFLFWICQLCAEVDRHISHQFLHDLTVIFIVSGPGAGKSTLANKIAETFLFRVNLKQKEKEKKRTH